jgi:hypothetical protein
VTDVTDPGPEAVDKILDSLETFKWSPTDVARQARRLRAHIEALRASSDSVPIVMRLDEASAAVDQALDEVSKLFGCGDPLFDWLTEARRTIGVTSARIAALQLDDSPAADTTPPHGGGGS